MPIVPIMRVFNLIFPSTGSAYYIVRISLLCSKIAINCHNNLLITHLVYHLLSYRPLTVPITMPLHRCMQVWRNMARPFLHMNRWLEGAKGVEIGLRRRVAISY